MLKGIPVKYEKSNWFYYCKDCGKEIKPDECYYKLEFLDNNTIELCENCGYDLHDKILDAHDDYVINKSNKK